MPGAHNGAGFGGLVGNFGAGFSGKRGLMQEMDARNDGRALRSGILAQGLGGLEGGVGAGTDSLETS